MSFQGWIQARMSALSWRTVEVQPDDIADLGDEQRILGILFVRVRHVQQIATGFNNQPTLTSPTTYWCCFD